MHFVSRPFKYKKSAIAFMCATPHTKFHDIVIFLLKPMSGISFSIQPFGKAVLGNIGLVVIPLLVSLSTFGAANGGLFAGGR